MSWEAGVVQFFHPGSQKQEDSRLYWTGQALASWGWLFSAGLSQSCPLHLHALNALPEQRGRWEGGCLRMEESTGPVRKGCLQLCEKCTLLFQDKLFFYVPFSVCCCRKAEINSLNGFIWLSVDSSFYSWTLSGLRSKPYSDALNLSFSFVY